MKEPWSLNLKGCPPLPIAVPVSAKPDIIIVFLACVNSSFRSLDTNTHTHTHTQIKTHTQTHTQLQMSHFQVLGVLNDVAAARSSAGVKGCRALALQSPTAPHHHHPLSLCYPWQPQTDTLLPASHAPPAYLRVYICEVCARKAGICDC